jgi:hypothetical protein
MPVQHSVCHADSWSAGAIGVVFGQPGTRRTANSRSKMKTATWGSAGSSGECDVFLELLAGVFAGVLIQSAPLAWAGADGAWILRVAECWMAGMI